MTLNSTSSLDGIGGWIDGYQSNFVHKHTLLLQSNNLSKEKESDT